MSDTAPPPKRKPAPVPPPRKAPRGDGEDGPTLPALAVRYYRRMRPQRVYPVTVSWKKSRDADKGSHPVVVRLLGGGAQIVPSEAALDPAKPDRSATFYLTPLALGVLRGVRVEVVHQGRNVLEIPLAASVVRQRRTLVLLLLTFLVPWLLATYKHGPTPEHWHWAEMGNDRVWAKQAATPGRAVQLNLEEEIPPVNDWLHNNMFPLSQVLTSLTSYLGQVYDVVHHAFVNEPERLPAQPDTIDEIINAVHRVTYYAPYYSFWLFLVLTVISFLRTQEKRKRKVAPPVELPASARQAATAGAEVGG